jgi:DNA repair protein RadC
MPTAGIINHRFDRCRFAGEAFPRRNMARAKKPKFDDNFIREVNVNYRTTTDKRFQIKAAGDIADFVRSVMTDNSREHCIAAYLDASHQIASYSIISIGGANLAFIAPREVFQRAVLIGAISIILAHNHPSGNLTPSSQDREVTDRLRKAGDIMGIPLLDHVIVTDGEFLSLREDTIGW